MQSAFANADDFAVRRQAPARVGPGTRATIRRGIVVSDVRIVSEAESDPDRGCIAAGSPLGRALIGGRSGEVVEYHAGGGIEEIRIMAIAAD